jgi:hypothetical protein
MKTKRVYCVFGTAKDQETIIRQRSAYEDYAKSIGKRYSSTELSWNMNKKGLFDFKLNFYE